MCSLVSCFIMQHSTDFSSFTPLRMQLCVSFLFFFIFLLPPKLTPTHTRSSMFYLFRKQKCLSSCYKRLQVPLSSTKSTRHFTLPGIEGLSTMKRQTQTFPWKQMVLYNIPGRIFTLLPTHKPQFALVLPAARAD